MIHLGRLRVVTKRKEGRCNNLHCPNERKIPPMERAFVLSVRVVRGETSFIVYKYYHPKCIGPWLEWRISTIPASKSGRRSMDLAPEAKEARLKLTRTRARLMRTLRTVKTGERLSRLVERIQALDVEIQATGYPTIPYKHRRSLAMLMLDKFVKEVKKQYQHPRRVPVSMWEKARELGVEYDFNEAMEEWFKEATEKTIARQGSDFEAEQEDKEEE